MSSGSQSTAANLRSLVSVKTGALAPSAAPGPVVASLGHLKSKAPDDGLEPWDRPAPGAVPLLRTNPNNPNFQPRQAHAGGNITHNKKEALFKFLKRKQERGEKLSDEQLKALAEACADEADGGLAVETGGKAAADAVKSPTVRKQMLAALAVKAAAETGIKPKSKAEQRRLIASASSIKSPTKAGEKGGRGGNGGRGGGNGNGNGGGRGRGGGKGKGNSTKTSQTAGNQKKRQGELGGKGGGGGKKQKKGGDGNGGGDLSAKLSRGLSSGRTVTRS